MDIISKYILEPLQYEFIQRALFASIAIGISCGLIGTYIMLRRLSLIGDALAHSVLPGVVISFMIAGKSEITLFFGAVIAGILTSLLIGFVNRNSKIKEDTSIGIIFTGAFALGVLLVSQLKQVHIDLSSYLFGDVLGVSTGDLALSGIITVVIALCILLFYKQLLITSFDPTLAMTIGISTTLVHYLLMSLLSMSIVAGLQSVGVILIIAMLITPPATAYLLSSRLKYILIISSLVGVLSAVIGLYLSYHLNFASGASIVLVAVAFFMLAFFFSPSEGLLVKRFRRIRAQRNAMIEDVIKMTFKLGGKTTEQELISALIKELGEREGKIKSAVRITLANNLLSEIKEGIIITEEGTALAKKLIRSHRLWETYITREHITGLKDIHPEAEKIEHLLPEELIDELDEELGFPEKDPHGSEIPRK